MSDWNPAESFVVPLLPALIGSIENIAPAKARELGNLLSRVRIVVSDEPGLDFYVHGDVDPRELRIPVAGLEFLWAISFAHLTIYQHAKRTSGTELDFSANTATAKAAKTLQFALSDRQDAPTKAWPSNLPRPSFYPTDERRDPTDIELATEVFACAVAWILHHELGHIALHHLDKSPKQIRDEVDADRAATEWLLVDAHEPTVVLKCGLGIATAIVGMASAILARGKPSNLKLYPPMGERLLDAMSHPALDSASQAHEYACYSLKVHLDHHGIAVAPETFNTAFDCLHSYSVTLIAIERQM